MRRSLPSLLLLTLAPLAQGQTQNALDFDGVNDEVNVANASVLIANATSFSMACRVYPTQNANWPNMEAFAGFRDNLSCDFYLLQTYGTTMEGRFRNSAGVVYTVDSVGVLQLNTWQFVALTYDGTTLNMYRNNDLIASAPASGNLTTTTGMFRIGNMPIPGSSQIFLDGRVDEVGLWKRALSPDELTCLAGGAADLTDPDLVLYYGCDQGVAGGNNTGISSLIDATGNLNGSLVGFTMNGASSNFVEGAGTGVSLSANVCPGATYLYDGAPLAAGTYTFTYTSSNGCDSVVNVTVNELPVNTNVSPGPITLTCLNSGASWQWLDCNNGFAEIPGATFQTYSPDENGSYAVEVTDNGCVDTSACYTVNAIGIAERRSQLPALLTPTITAGPLRMLLDASGGTLAITVSDACGRVVMRSQGKAEREQWLDVSGLSTGTYHVFVSVDDRSRMLRFVKE